MSHPAGAAPQRRGSGQASAALSRSAWAQRGLGSTPDATSHLRYCVPSPWLARDFRTRLARGAHRTRHDRPKEPQSVRRGSDPSESRGDLVGAQPGPGPGGPRRPAVQRVQVRARRPGQPRRAGRHRRVPLGSHPGPLHRPVRAHRAYLPGPAGSRGHHPSLRPGHRRRADQARRPPPEGLGSGPEPDPRRLDRGRPHRAGTPVPWTCRPARDRDTTQCGRPDHRGAITAPRRGPCG